MSMIANLWSVLPLPLLVIDRDDCIMAVNSAAEVFLGLSEAQLVTRRTEPLFGSGSRAVDLIRIVRGASPTAADSNVEFSWPGRAPERVDLLAASDPSGEVLLMIQPRSFAEQIDKSLSHRNAARSVSGMAAMLAHEIKNPLAGISGAAQLLEMNATAEERALTELIRDETRRIEALVTRVEAFGEAGPLTLKPVNIHDVLGRAKRSAEAGFAAHIRFVEEYDPSLPDVLGDADHLIQLCLNLLKNAAEAAPRSGGTITLNTAYQPGVVMAGPKGARISLPLVISVTDNGAGVPEAMQPDIFEPFVTSKAGGGGLGLALVAKITADHGGAIDCISRPGSTTFRLRLPIWREESGA